MNKNLTIAICLTIALTIVLAAVSFAAAPQEEKAPSRVIKLKAGEEFTVVLGSNKTTGFEWQLAMPLDEKVVRLVSSEYTPVESKLIGSGGKEVWTFKTVGAGKADILFKYVRPWEKDTPPAKTESFSIVVE